MDEIFNILRTWQHRKNPLAVHMLLYFITHAAKTDTIEKGVALKRGQLLTGRVRLQEAMEMSEWMLRSTLEKLIESGRVTREVTHDKSIITVCNYDRYFHENEMCHTQNLTAYCYSKLRQQVYDKIDFVFSRPEFTERKGLLKFIIPINQGGSRQPQISFENDVGVEVRAGVEVVRIERGL